MPTEQKYYLPEGLPTPRAQRDGLDKEFWEATRRHELTVQRCTDCATFQWGPEAICHKCYSANMGWYKVAGRGRLFSWTRSWNPPSGRNTGAVALSRIAQGGELMRRAPL